jgi:two-component system cell cycle sensor histidine kinase/response regulator CckA
MSKDKQRIGDTQYFKDEVDDFVHRKPNPNPIYIGITLALMFTITILGLVKADGSGGIIAVVTAAFLGLGGYLTWQIIKANDDLLAGDFENALYAGGMNAAHEFTILVREDQNVVYISPGFAKYFKHDNKESSETLEWLLVSMNMDENAKQQLISAVSNKEHANTLFAFTDAFGFKRSLKLHVEPVKRPKGFYLIRAKKVGDEEDSEFERGSLFSIVSYIMEMLPMNCYIMNEQDVFIHTNQSFASMVGYSVDELGDGSKTWTNLQYGTNDLSGGSGGTWQGEVAFKNRNNKPLRAMVQQIVLGADESGNGGIKCGFAMNTDNKGSSEGSKGWQEILALSPVPFGIIDEFGKVLFSNASLRKITGRKEEELKDWSLMQTLSAESKTEVHELLKMVKDPTTRPRATPVNVEIPLQNNEVVATVHITPNFKDGLEEPQFMVHMIDTTEFKNLELRVVHSQKMQAVGQLAGGIAHDFNNLLTAMMGFCDLLLIRHPSGDPSFADIMQIKQNANRAANLVRQLLAFSRKQTLQPDIIDITEILAELSNLIRRLIGENIELKISHGRDIYAVKVDQGQFEQVVINLAGNGRDAMNDGGVLAIKTQCPHRCGHCAAGRG